MHSSAAGEVKVAQLVKHLDLKKDECIQRTFQGVSKNFKTIFSELVPGGKGELIMLCGAKVSAAKPNVV